VADGQGCVIQVILRALEVVTEHNGWRRTGQDCVLHDGWVVFAVSVESHRANERPRSPGVSKGAMKSLILQKSGSRNSSAYI
jgi:hypothetical protein